MGTSGNYFYRPSYGASGTDEFDKFDAGLASADTELTNAKNHREATSGVHGVSASGFEDKANKDAASGYAGLNASLQVIKEPASKGQANGIASLDASALVPLAQIPATLTGKDADTVDTKHFTDIQADAQSKVDTHAALTTGIHGVGASTVDSAANRDSAIETHRSSATHGTAQPVTVRKNSGTDVGTRKRLNLIEGTNITLTVADDATDNEVDVTITGTGGVTSEGEGHITILPYNYSGITAGTWVIYISTAQALNFLFENSSAAQNDQVDYKAYLAAGTYTLVVLHEKYNNRGIISILINGTSIGTIDCYAVSQAFNVRSTITGISVTTSGLKTISVKVSDKNASSTGYGVFFTSLAFFRTA
jgi:hypothetical protein